MENNKVTLREHVKKSIQEYLSRLDGFPAVEIYAMVLAEVERPLLESIMLHTNGNQSKAAGILGLSRGTLRKKLKEYDLLDA
jgi:Fis family transcriptional regulator